MNQVAENNDGQAVSTGAVFDPQWTQDVYDPMKMVEVVKVDKPEFNQVLACPVLREFMEVDLPYRLRSYSVPIDGDENSWHVFSTVDGEFLKWIHDKAVDHAVKPETTAEDADDLFDFCYALTDECRRLGIEPVTQLPDGYSPPKMRTGHASRNQRAPVR